MSTRRNALFSFHPGLLSGRQIRARGRQIYNRRVARMVRKARKHRYDWIPEGGAGKSGGMSAVASDVALALEGQGFKRGAARKAARSARGKDFESLFRSALTKAKGNPMSKKRAKKKKRNSRKGKMPAGLAKYWAKKRARKSHSRPRVNSIRIPGTLTRSQAKAMARGIARATGRPVKLQHGKH